MRWPEIFYKPESVTREIAAKPRMAVPVAVNILGYLLVLLVLWVFLGEELVNLSLEPIDLLEKAEVNNFRMFSVLTSFLTYLAVPVVMAFFINLQMPLYGKSYCYKALLSLCFHGLLILTAGELISLIPRLLLSDPTFAFSLPHVFDMSLPQPAMITLEYLDVFIIWFHGAVIAGVRVLTGLTMRRSAAVVLLPSVLMLVVAMIG